MCDLAHIVGGVMGIQDGIWRREIFSATEVLLVFLRSWVAKNPARRNDTAVALLHQGSG
jgi:hypothetical protein